MQSHPPRPPACPTPQTPGSAKPPWTRETRPVSGIVPRTAQIHTRASLLRAVRALLRRVRSTPLGGRKTAPSPAPLVSPVPCKNCTPMPPSSTGFSLRGTGTPACAPDPAATTKKLEGVPSFARFCAKGGSIDRRARFSFRSLFSSGRGTRSIGHVPPIRAIIIPRAKGPP